MESAQRQAGTAPGAFVAFARFVLCGGGVGVASSFAVVALAAWMPWALANALITIASTLLATELHARFTFGAGGRGTWRQHLQSAGSAAAAYAVTCVAMLVLQQLVAAPGALIEQAVYLSASALAGVGRFVVLRLVVFAGGRKKGEAALGTAPAQVPAPAQAQLVRAPRAGHSAPAARPAVRYHDVGVIGAGAAPAVCSAA